MSIPAGFARARKSKLCPACGKGDWCLVAIDGSRSICARIASARRWGRAGWLHIFSESPAENLPLPTWSAARRADVERERQAELKMRADLDFPSLARRFERAADSSTVRELAKSLGLSVGSLREQGVGLAARYVMPRREGPPAVVTAWTFPIFDALGCVVGIRFRTQDGVKFVHTYSNSVGLHLPRGLLRTFPAGGVLFTPEGSTSLAALRMLGLWAVGRPNNSQGEVALVALCRRIKPGAIVFLGENDRKWNETRQCWIHPGLEGTRSISEAVRASGACPCVRVILPPAEVKDAREWLKAWRMEMGPGAPRAMRGWIDSQLGLSRGRRRRRGEQEAAVA